MVSAKGNLLYIDIKVNDFEIILFNPDYIQPLLIPEHISFTTHFLTKKNYPNVIVNILIPPFGMAYYTHIGCYQYIKSNAEIGNRNVSFFALEPLLVIF